MTATSPAGWARAGTARDSASRIAGARFLFDMGVSLGVWKRATRRDDLHRKRAA
jgi:hypothetical protein